MVCFTRGKNLREEICQAKLPPISLARPVEDGFKRCGRSKCRLCPYTNLNPGQVLKSVTISSTGEQLAIRGSITCTTSNLLYIGTCSKGDRTCPGHNTVVRQGRVLRRGSVGTGIPSYRIVTRTPTYQWVHISKE